MLSDTPASRADLDPSDHYPGESPQQVAFPVSVQDWSRLTFLHWRIDPAVVQRLLPSSLEVDMCDGSAWVGLVPFCMRILRGLAPAIPHVTVFPEANVRPMSGVQMDVPASCFSRLLIPIQSWPVILVL